MVATLYKKWQCRNWKNCQATFHSETKKETQAVEQVNNLPRTSIGKKNKFNENPVTAQELLYDRSIFHIPTNFSIV